MKTALILLETLSELRSLAFWPVTLFATALAARLIKILVFSQWWVGAGLKRGEASSAVVG